MKKVFFYIFRIKVNAGHIYLRVLDWASYMMGKKPQGDFYQSSYRKPGNPKPDNMETAGFMRCGLSRD